MLKILAHAGAIIGLYLALSLVLFLGLQVKPLFGNIGLVAFGTVVVSYVYRMHRRSGIEPMVVRWGDKHFHADSGTPGFDCPADPAALGTRI